MPHAVRLAPFALAVALLASPALAAGGRPIEGEISAFECGDNCYLTVVTDAGKEINALCAVGPCVSWAENAEMPAKFVGRRVGGTLGSGMRYDGDGNKMGKYPAFETLKLK
ncbi:MAG: hypothetical protein ABTQ29_13970 [Siculibacillus sp.]